jgi:hypothetical protein
MIRVLAAAAFALTIATSSKAMSLRRFTSRKARLREVRYGVQGKFAADGIEPAF